MCLHPGAVIWWIQPVLYINWVLFQKEEEGWELIRVRKDKFMFRPGHLNTEGMTPCVSCSGLPYLV